MDTSGFIITCLLKTYSEEGEIMREVLFNTVHGSRLYGLAHAQSDVDYFTVVSKKGGTTAHTKKRYAKQSIVEGVDSTVVDLGTFMVGCEKGVPQFLEAMFSEQSICDDKIESLRRSYRCGTGVLETYFRTMKSFALAEGYKSKRHALRLALNARDITLSGRFNPRLNDSQIEDISRGAHMHQHDVYRLAVDIVWHGL